MIHPVNPHDYADKRNWPLSQGQRRKLKEREPARYETYMKWVEEQANAHQATKDDIDAAWRLSPEGLHERIEDLEEANRQLRLRVERLEDPHLRSEG